MKPLFGKKSELFRHKEVDIPVVKVLYFYRFGTKA